MRAFCSIVFPVFLLTGCLSLQTTSQSFSSSNFGNKLPSVVGVMSLEGEEPYATDARKRLTEDLKETGLFTKVYDLDDLREGVEWTTQDFLAPSSRALLKRNLRLQGIFTSRITAFKNMVAGNAHMYTDLIDVETGKILWSCHSQDDRLMSETVEKRVTIARATWNTSKKLSKDYSGNVPQWRG